MTLELLMVERYPKVWREFYHPFCKQEDNVIVSFVIIFLVVFFLFVLASVAFHRAMYFPPSDGENLMKLYISVH